MSEADGGFRSGLVSVVGRPNVGKSTLVNAVIGAKVTIVARSPNTTRRRVRGILEGPGFQAVFVDTPGLHRPRSALSERLNAEARAGLQGVDICVLVVDATAPIGPGDRFVASSLPEDSVVVVNKTDLAGPERTLAQLARTAELGLVGAECFPLSARTSEGVSAFVDHVVSHLGPGPRYFPEGTVRDVPEAFFVAELVREQLLRSLREELPHSLACLVTEWEWPYIRCEVVVERPSQRAIVLGKKGAVMKHVGETVRRSLAPGAYLDLHVTIERSWPRRGELLDRLGY